ncbi:putative methyltransferase [Plasmodium gaboni]|uniref:tRNA (guanine-N(7)-)-methyltransferase n=1 Tax=Plasmodium gaboni TaxID=647221 RepID=A0A151LIV6_9APIC|nr:putative methyltransferase [Plasmodium gaboni]KYN98911.1 putative methyltransferase [Plasmodium gaboni]
MKKHKTPCKRKYRQRAHCNPLSDSYIKYPRNYEYVDWSLHFPFYFDKNKNEDEYITNKENSKDEHMITDNINNDKSDNINNDKSDNINNVLYLNTNKYPVNYKIKNKFNQFYENNKDVTILDIGCGYGGLLFSLSKIFNDKLILGLEIRDKITNYVGEKILSYRYNYNPYYHNISVIRTNVIKFLPNYIKKNQIEKIFFCFPDPHFKKHNWRRRIITIENLSLYYHLLKNNGYIYFITDVYTLYLWVIFCFSKCSYFKLLTKKDCENDICVKLIHESSEESKKVKKNKQNMYYCVAQKIL